MLSLSPAMVTVYQWPDKLRPRECTTNEYVAPITLGPTLPSSPSIGAFLSIHVVCSQVNVFLTYMGDRYLELEDVDNVHLKLHPLVYTNKTWTPRKLLLRVRRDVILDVLSQVCRRIAYGCEVVGRSWNWKVV